MQSKQEHATPLLKELLWLPVKFRIHHEIAVLMYHHFGGSLPLYLSALLTTYRTAQQFTSFSEKNPHSIEIQPQSLSLFFVGARHGHLPGFLATINIKQLTPFPSLLFGCVTSLIMLSSSDIYALINYASFVEALFIGMSIGGLLLLRVTRPDMKRPIKVSIVYPLFYLIVCVFLVITPLTSSPWECLMGLIVIASGIPFYFLGVLWKKKPRGFMIVLRKVTILSQKLFYASPEEMKEE